MREKDKISHQMRSSNLEEVGGIKFSLREIDVLACVLCGQEAKEIAVTLSTPFRQISPRTVDAHTRNILQKLKITNHLSHPTREWIADFVLRSKEHQILKQHFINLFAQNLFFKKLKNVMEMSEVKFESCQVHIQADEHSNEFVKKFESYLHFVGLTLINENLSQQSNEVRDINFSISAKDSDSTFMDFPNPAFFMIPQNEHKHFLFQVHITKDSSNKTLGNTIYVFNERNDFSLMLKFLADLFPKVGFEIISAEIENKIKDQWSKLPNIKSTFPCIPVTPNKPYCSTKSVRILLVVSLVFISLISLGSYNFYFNYQNKVIARSDLVLPHETVLLKRYHLLDEIDNKLKKQKSIQSISLIGQGGIGKTTLARMYANEQDAHITWEIDAETPENLRNSFENLTNHLAKTEEEKKEFRNIQEIKDPLKKADAVLNFVKNKLHQNPGWFLIYDNVSSLEDIHKYFPHDPKTWGRGKVILTTRDNNVSYNNQVGEHLFIPDLNQKEKSELFAKITNHGSSPITTNFISEANLKLVEKLPSFPLDITVAAYYIKTTKVPIKEYINDLNLSESRFRKVQENVLRNSTNYKNTRFQIIGTSLKRLNDSSKDFVDLMYFISLLDSQNIPIDLLYKLKSRIIVDDFIFHLKKYSLITHESSHAGVEPTLALHRSTQDLCYDYLSDSLQEGKKKQLLEQITSALEAYFEDILSKEKFQTMNQLESHLNAVLRHKNELTPTIKGVVESELGCIYYFRNSYDEAIQHINSSLSFLDIEPTENKIRRARALTHFGKVYRDKNEYKTAENYFRQALNVFKKSSETNKRDLSRTLAYLGSVTSELEKFDEGRHYLEEALQINEEENNSPLLRAWIFLHLAFIERQIGNYEQAEKFYENCLSIYKEASNELRTYRVMGSLSQIYFKLGEYEKAIAIIKEALEKYTKRISDQDINAAGLLFHLANAYAKLGMYKEAKATYEKSLDLHCKLFEKSNVRYLSVLGQYGLILAELGDTKTAIEHIEKAHSVIEEHYGPGHLETAEMLINLGRAYLLDHNIEKTEEIFTKTVKIYEHKNHPQVFIVYESLADLYKAKGDQSFKTGIQEEVPFYFEKAKNYLNLSLQSLNKQFPKDSPHALRVKAKLDKISHP